MYLSPFDNDSNSLLYQSFRPPVKSNLENNKKVCLGGFSGSGSDYYMYKSNCHDLMKEQCALQWDETCEQYVMSTNPKENELFRTEVALMKEPYPLSDTNSCYSTSSLFPNKITTYGINPVLVNNVVVPLSCNKSTYSHLSSSNQNIYQQSKQDVQKNMVELRQPYDDAILQQRINDQVRLQQQEENNRFMKQQLENERIQKQYDDMIRLQKEQEEMISQKQFNSYQNEARVKQEQEIHDRFQQEQETNARLKQEQEEMVIKQNEVELDRLKKEQTPIEQDVVVQNDILRNPPVEQDFYSLLMNPSDCKKSACDISKLIDNE